MRLHHRDAELLDRRHHQGTTAGVEVSHAAVVYATKEGRMGKAAPQAGEIRALTDHFDLDAGELRRGKRQLHVLMSCDLTHQEEVVLRGGGAIEALHLDGRVHYGRISPVEVCDALTCELRDCDVSGDAAGCTQVPASHSAEQGTREGPDRSG
jgi:hypothetical protein